MDPNVPSPGSGTTNPILLYRMSIALKTVQMQSRTLGTIFSNDCSGQVVHCQNDMTSRSRSLSGSMFQPMLTNTGEKSESILYLLFCVPALGACKQVFGKSGDINSVTFRGQFYGLHFFGMADNFMPKSRLFYDCIRMKQLLGVLRYSQWDAKLHYKARNMPLKRAGPSVEGYVVDCCGWLHFHGRHLDSFHVSIRLYAENGLC